MYDFFPQGVSVINFVILGMEGGKITPVHKFRLAKSAEDMKRFASWGDGPPIFGPRCYRERTKAEIKREGLTGADYVSTLVPLTTRPWLDTAKLAQEWKNSKAAA